MYTTAQALIQTAESYAIPEAVAAISVVTILRRFVVVK